MTETITEAQWYIAHQMAIALVKDDTDPNELSKAMAYLRFISHQQDACNRFFKYLGTLVSNGRQIGHSKRTPDYYRSIDRVCKEHLRDVGNEPAVLQQILGWTVRLMHYYKDIPIAEMEAAAKPQPQKSQRQEAVATLTARKQYAIGDKLEAKIASISGNKVTYEMEGGAIKLTQKEPKLFDKLHVGQTTTVQVTELLKDGAVKKISLVF